MSKYKFFCKKTYENSKKNEWNIKKSGKYKKYKIDKTNQVKINYQKKINNQIEDKYQIEK